MSRDRDDSRGWAAEVAARSPLKEVAPLPRIELDGVSKVYRDPMTLRPFTAVDGVSIRLEEGEIFGLLGPNGAGKTSTIKMILGLTRPTRGTIRLEGRDPQDPAARKRLGYLPENPCFYDHLTAREYLGLVGALFGIEARIARARAEALLERLGLGEHARKPLRKFSKGMTQRLGLCQALLNEPGVLVLDEPMSGLDPIGRSDVKHILREERDRGATILMTSHVLAETETLCDRIAILHHGRVLEMGSVKGILESDVLEWEITVEALPEERGSLLRAAGHRVDSVGSCWIVRVQDSGALQEILRALTEERVVVRAVEPRRQSLEEYFVRALEADGAGSGPGTKGPGRR
ncbi:MAG: ABC transporter ATP-binding protein [Candidatus Eisenbacteria bacterium]|uniref:ABC transporter ATP-binding protein n=1 Tax=Eiseniibacteriota bacterium TaxID=2212470 RepID=A0A538TA14_UNCEI|nr:MAG: ABC transporter ATP-binding protein [Candidatus Eisenbacteria bacterium]